MLRRRTSISAPIFAGILALLNQHQISTGAQSTPGLGNINPMLYTLAQTTPGIFHDVTVGSNIVPCQVGTPDCPDGTLGYSAGPGYDQASGLGSANVYKLVTQWSVRPPAATAITVTASPGSIAVSASLKITVAVKADTGTATPTGSVNFSVGSTTLGDVTLAGSGGTATASLTIAGNQLAVGNNKIMASYSGNTGFSPCAATVAVTVTVPTATSAAIPSVTPNPVYQQQTDADGYSWFYTVTLTEVAGVATTLTGFSIGDSDYSSSIVSFFGSASLPAKRDSVRVLAQQARERTRNAGIHVLRRGCQRCEMEPTDFRAVLRPAVCGVDGSFQFPGCRRHEPEQQRLHG